MRADEARDVHRLLVEYARLREKHVELLRTISEIADERKVVVDALMDICGGSQTAVGKLVGISPQMVNRIVSRGSKRRKVNDKGNGYPKT